MWAVSRINPKCWVGIQALMRAGVCMRIPPYTSHVHHAHARWCELVFPRQSACRPSRLQRTRLPSHAGPAATHRSKQRHGLSPAVCRRALATVPLLSKVLSRNSLHVLVQRRLNWSSQWQQLDDLLVAVREKGVPLLVLFPGPGVSGRASVFALAGGAYGVVPHCSTCQTKTSG